MGGTGAAYEARYCGRDLRVVVVKKANIERSGAVAEGLCAINCYLETVSGPCREYTIDALIDGRERIVNGTACREPDGTWRVQG